MKKAKVNKIYLSDKIYIKKKDVEDDDLLLSLYTYDNGDEFLSTISEDEDYYIVPSNSYTNLSGTRLKTIETLNKQKQISTLQDLSDGNNKKL